MAASTNIKMETAARESQKNAKHWKNSRFHVTQMQPICDIFLNSEANSESSFGGFERVGVITTSRSNDGIKGESSWKGNDMSVFLRAKAPDCSSN